jgi:hypothetical protein
MSCIVLIVAGANRLECDEDERMDPVNADLMLLRLRMAGIGAQLDGNWSKTLDGQRHLDVESDECAYWHSGYHQALADIVTLMSKPDVIDDTADTSSPFHAVG